MVACPIETKEAISEPLRRRNISRRATGPEVGWLNGA
jgi:hypothetical protein